MIRRLNPVLFLIMFSLAMYVLYWFLFGKEFLSFSDGAKFADIARNIKNGEGYGSRFSFFTESGFEETPTGLFSARWILPLMPLSILVNFLIIGVNDFAVVFTSGIFYLGLICFTYMIGKKLFNELVGCLAALSVAANINLLDYATSGASETLFIFEILLAIYFFLLKKKWANIAGSLTLLALFFTRPHAPIYILGIWIFYLLINYKTTKSFVRALGLTVVVTIFIELFLQFFSGRFFLESLFKRGSIAALSYSSSSTGDVVLRGEAAGDITGLLRNILPVTKKAFYNLYNYYRLLPQIASPYMWGLFVVGLFKWNVKQGNTLKRKDRVENSLKVTTIFMVLVTFLVTALTIPFFRYLHPVVPLIYLFATATLVWIVREIANGQWAMVKKWPITKRLKKETLVTVISGFLIFFFVVGQTLGVIFLDSRFKEARTNRGKPPVYVQLSWILRNHTKKDAVIITNLDTWGSWYGERKTIWFPLKPEQLIPKDNEEIYFDAIYLTSYLIGDENYYMGEEWRQIFYNPEAPENEFIESNYELTGIYTIPAEETYEKQVARAVLLTRKKINGL